MLKATALACVFGYTTLSVFARVVSQAEVESRDGVAARSPRTMENRLDDARNIEGIRERPWLD
jgi:hypothetical protein